MINESLEVRDKGKPQKQRDKGGSVKLDNFRERVYPPGRLDSWPRHCEKVLPFIYEAWAHADGVILDTGLLK